ncbi:LysR family transcriptional regulator [Shewanella maritima]|uniref:LysR family transcriptional regulator n=1 Tax=Shewanella maritima TaxID=2520507 RepID=A0A411PJW6_9GAMM|nr:LysR family transcriptional regulator [Shewanella maritima]QBF83839.1 LysR family transcriptional regulator [Shewanella maritima]
MDLNLLSTFIQVYNCKSYTKASVEIGISQAAVSQRIKQLEQQLGAALFIRKGRSIEPTSQANYMMTKLAPAENLVREALYEVGYKVYVQEQFAYDLANSGLHLVDAPHSQMQIFEDLRNRKVDLAIDFVTANDPSIVSEPLCSDKMIIALANNHPRIGDELTEEQYYNEQHVTIKTRRQDIDTFTILAENPAPRDIVFNAGSMSAQLTYVANSEALGLTTERMKKYVQALGLRFVEPPIKLINVEFQLLFHRANLSNKAHKELRAKVKQLIQAV